MPSRLLSESHVLKLSLLLNALLSLVLLLGAGSYLNPSEQQQALRNDFIRWHGGHPADDKSGTCWCGNDKYCMCTPNVAIDLVVLSGKDHVWLVRRKDTDQLATIGGFVKVGETVENAVLRELEEETGLKNLPSPPVFFGMYSDPRRDNRRHTVSVAYAVHLDGDERPVAADDVKDVIKIPLSDIEKQDYFSDHKTILLDYRRILQNRRSLSQFQSSPGDFENDIVRSVCVLDQLS